MNAITSYPCSLSQTRIQDVSRPPLYAKTTVLLLADIFKLLENYLSYLEIVETLPTANRVKCAMRDVAEVFLFCSFRVCCDPCSDWLKVHTDAHDWLIIVFSDQGWTAVVHSGAKSKNIMMTIIFPRIGHNTAGDIFLGSWHCRCVPFFGKFNFPLNIVKWPVPAQTGYPSLVR